MYSQLDKLVPVLGLAISLGGVPSHSYLAFPIGLSHWAIVYHRGCVCLLINARL